MDVSVLDSYKVVVVRPKVQLTVTSTGGFGKLCGIRCNGAPCVAKGLHSFLMGTALSGEEAAPLFTQLFKECVLHSKLRHPNIVQFIGVEYGKDHSRHDLLLVTEQIDTELSSCLRTYPTIPLTTKLSVLRDVSAGLLYLHSFNPPIIHGDLTTTHILLTQDWRAKIADFGNSVEQSISAIHIAPGALPYMPPEAFAVPQQYDSKLDIFSFGIVALYVGIQTCDADRNKRAEQIQCLVAASELNCLYKIVIWCCDEDLVKRPLSWELNNHLQALCVETQISDSSLKLVETGTLLQTIETLKRDKVRAENKASEVQRELEDVKKVKNQEMNKLKEEIKDLKSKLEHEMAQSVSYKLDFEREREDRTKVIERIEAMKTERGASNSRIHTTFFSKHLDGNEQQLKKWKQKIDEMEGELQSYKTAAETLKEVIRHHIQDELAGKEKISSLEEELRAAKTKIEMFVTSSLHAKSAEKEDIILQEELRATKMENDILKNEVDKFKATLIKCGEMSASHPETEVTIARALKQKTEALKNQIMEEEKAKNERELADLRAQLQSVKENLNAMEILMQRQLKDLNVQLTEAKEEIAVKVAQVKQYQKQVEAYKHQVHTSSQSISSSMVQLPLESSTGIEPMDLHTTPVLATQMATIDNTRKVGTPSQCHNAPLPVPEVTGNPMMSSNNEINSVCSTEKVRAAIMSHDPRCVPDGGNEHAVDDDLPSPIFVNALHANGPSQKDSHPSNMEAPHPLHTPFQLDAQPSHYANAPGGQRNYIHVRDDELSALGRSYSDRNDCNHMEHYVPIVVQDRYWASEVPLPPGQHTSPSKPYSAQMQKNTSVAEGAHAHVSAIAQGNDCIPLDPNLKCPVCGTMFRKGEIQKFKCHAEACAKGTTLYSSRY